MSVLMIGMSQGKLFPRISRQLYFLESTDRFVIFLYLVPNFGLILRFCTCLRSLVEIEDGKLAFVPKQFGKTFGKDVWQAATSKTQRILTR